MFNNTHLGSWRVYPGMSGLFSQCLKCVLDPTPFVQVLFRNSFFGTFLLYTPMERGVIRRDSAHVTPIVKLCIHTMF